MGIWFNKHEYRKLPTSAKRLIFNPDSCKIASSTNAQDAMTEIDNTVSSLDATLSDLGLADDNGTWIKTKSSSVAIVDSTRKAYKGIAASDFLINGKTSINATLTDNSSLETTSKSVVGAINEINTNKVNYIAITVPVDSTSYATTIDSSNYRIVSVIQTNPYNAVAKVSGVQNIDGYWNLIFSEKTQVGVSAFIIGYVNVSSVN